VVVDRELQVVAQDLSVAGRNVEIGASLASEPLPPATVPAGPITSRLVWSPGFVGDRS
jgi:hypothetical protein